MPRVLTPVLVVPALLLMLVAPVAAAPPMKESGTQEFLFAVSTECSGATCTDTLVDAFSIDSETVVVCVSQFTFNVRNGRLTSEASGCSETTPDALTVTSSLSATLAPTSVQLCDRRSCDDVVVSASLSPTGGPVFTHSDRGTFSDGTCTFRFSSSGSSTEVSGTITLDGLTSDAFGTVGVSEFRVSTRCR